MARDSERVPVETPPQGTNKVVMSRIEVADLIRPTTQMAPLFGEGTTDEPLVIEEHVPTPSGEHAAIAARESLPAMPIVDLRMSGMQPIEDQVSDRVVVIPPVIARTKTPPKVITIPPRETDTVQTPPLEVGTAPTVPLPLVPDAPIVAHEAAPVSIDDRASDATVKNRSAATSLGVAPLEPATIVRAPFVNDTPVQRWSPLPRTPASSTAPANAAAQPQTHPILTPVAQGSTRMPTIPPTGDAEDNRHERTAMIALDPSSGMPRSGPWQALVSVAKSLGSVRWWLRRRKTSRVKPLER